MGHYSSQQISSTFQHSFLLLSTFLQITWSYQTCFSFSFQGCLRLKHTLVVPPHIFQVFDSNSVLGLTQQITTGVALKNNNTEIYSVTVLEAINLKLSYQKGHGLSRDTWENSSRFWWLQAFLELELSNSNPCLYLHIADPFMCPFIFSSLTRKFIIGFKATPIQDDLISRFYIHYYYICKGSFSK